MRAYFEDRSHYTNPMSHYTAYEGFLRMGFELIQCRNIDDVFADNESVVVGSVGFIQGVLNKRNISFPVDFSYPPSLTKYLGRKMETSTLNTLQAEQQWNVFIKPKNACKLFTGRVVRSIRDLAGCGNQFDDTEIWVSELKTFVAEWRVFIRYGKVLNVRKYTGDWRCSFDSNIIENAVADFTDAPNAYALDFGVTKDGATLLIEANEGYSLGAYGLDFFDYAKLLSARWSQLCGQKDLCDF